MCYGWMLIISAQLNALEAIMYIRETFRAVGEIGAKSVRQMTHLLPKDWRVLFLSVID